MAATEEIRLASLTKRCPDCELVKPWSEYYPRTRWADGTTRAPQSRCKDCLRIDTRLRARARYASDPDGERARVEAIRDSMREDPVAWEAYRERANEYNAVWRRQRGMSARSFTDRRAPVDREGQELLPIGPWRAHVEELLVALAETVEFPVQVLAGRMGVSASTLRDWRVHSQSVVLDVIDRACCEMGEPLALRDLYPHLYESGAVAA